MTFSGKDGYQAKLNFSPLNDRYAGKLITMNYARTGARSRVQPLLSSPPPPPPPPPPPVCTPRVSRSSPCLLSSKLYLVLHSMYIYIYIYIYVDARDKESFRRKPGTFRTLNR